MSTLGITKRIDELGRIVIPKEIRENFRIKSGDNLEISVNNDKIEIKKNNILKSINDISSIYIDTLYSFLRKTIMLINDDKILNSSLDVRKLCLNKNLSEDFKNILFDKVSILSDSKKDMEICSDFFIDAYFFIVNIYKNGDIIGRLVIISEEKIDDKEKDILLIAGKFLTKYLEE